MNQVIEYFDRISEAPDAISRLRRFILDLAVRGKLVEQDPNDEPASELLKRIKPEKTQAREALTKRWLEELHAGLPELPRGWRWVKLGHLLLGDSQNGISKKPDDAPDGIPILRISACTVRNDGIVAEEEHKLIGGVSQKQREQYALNSGLACRFNGNRGCVGRLAVYVRYLSASTQSIPIN